MRVGWLGWEGESKVGKYDRVGWQQGKAGRGWESESDNSCMVMVG